MNDNKTLVLAYLDAVTRKDVKKLEALLAADLLFVSPAMTRHSAGEYLDALNRLAAIHVRNDVKRMFAEGDEVCVIYDFVTDTVAGAVPTIEWIRVGAGRIRSINLYYDRLPWKAVTEELTRRAVAA
jgi:ketosteroid isomerase-like protein